MILEKLKDHPSLIHTVDMISLCKPLEIINISSFSHLRSFHDGRFAVLCNKPDFLLNYAQKKYYNTDPCVHIIKPQTYDIGQYLVWDSVDCYGKTASMLQDSADFGFKHVFTIIKHHTEYTDFYHLELIFQIRLLIKCTLTTSIYWMVLFLFCIKNSKVIMLY